MFEKIYKSCRLKVIELSRKLSTALGKIPVILPDARYKLIWDGWVMIARLYFMFVIPLDLSIAK
jgi:hypothetical protein